jgi:hypothetical protein
MMYPNLSYPTFAAKERVRYMPLGLVVYKASRKSWQFVIPRKSGLGKNLCETMEFHPKSRAFLLMLP